MLLLECINKIFQFSNELKNSEEFENDTKSFDAVLMNFIVLGESISKLSDEFKDHHKHIEWRKIYAFRNVIAHDYFGLLPEEIWQIIKKNLPQLYVDLKKIENE